MRGRAKGSNSTGEGKGLAGFALLVNRFERISGAVVDVNRIPHTVGHAATNRTNPHKFGGIGIEAGAGGDKVDRINICGGRLVDNGLLREAKQRTRCNKQHNGGNNPKPVIFQM